MTAEKITLPGVDDDTNDTLNLLLTRLDEKQPRNLLRASYYDGKRAIRQVGTVIPPTYYRLGIVLGWSAKAVDTLADRCNLERFTWPNGTLDDIGYEDLWDANDLGAEVAAGIVSAFVHGVVFAITTRGDESAGEPRALIHFKDAINATGEWNARTRRLDNLLSITGRDDDGRVDSLALYLDGLTITAERDRDLWTVDRQEHAWGVPAEPLVYKPRTGRAFGSSRISRSVMSLHDQALRTVIRMEGHADVYSFPQMWLLGADEGIFKNPDGTMKAGWQVMLGRVMGIPDDDEAVTPRADVKQFAASSPQPHIDQLKQQAQLFSGETSIPLTSLGVSDMSNPTSADSYIASREDLIALAEKATEDWIGPRLARTVRRALAIQNDLDDVPPEWTGPSGIRPKWRSPVHLSRAAAADAGTKQLGAVPWLADTEVGLELLGLDDSQIRRAMAERRRADGRGVLQALRDAAEAVSVADG